MSCSFNSRERKLKIDQLLNILPILSIPKNFLISFKTLNFTHEGNTYVDDML